PSSIRSDATRPTGPCRTTSPRPSPVTPRARPMSRIQPYGLLYSARRVAHRMSTVVLNHGAWVTPACWNNFIDRFTKRGYECIAPAWPRKDQSIERLRADPSRLAGLGVQEIVDRYDGIIRDQAEPTMLVGHE